VLAPVVVAAIFFAPQSPSGEILRGPHGVPHVFAETLDGAFYSAGYAVAQDRLYQMDLSRRSSLGQLAGLTGSSAVASDTSAIKFGYTSEEYAEMFAALPPQARAALASYAQGVTAWIEEAARTGKLPPQYGGAKPRAWDVVDSLAISVNLARQFGRFGAGEIRNLLLTTLVQDKAKGNLAKLVDDFLWQNDPAAIATVSPADDPFKGASPFPRQKAGVLEAHLKLLPKANPLELLPGIRIEEQSDLKEMAAQVGAPYKWGSYCVVVSKERSANGEPILMNGPQMGFAVPSIVHQISISCPQYTAVGMDVPGIPGVLVGHSPKAAWGFTSGVADTDDVFFVKLDPKDSSRYWFHGGWREFQVTEVALPVKGGQPASAKREMSEYGPVIIKSPATGVAYVRKSSIWGQEALNIARILDLPSAASASDFRSIALGLTANMNLFCATASGDSAWFFCGRVPLRSPNADPRFPTPGDGAHDWTGILSPQKMPFVINPKSGLIANWNNKPVSWWPNFDTPVWGRIFRNETLLKALPARPLSPQDLEAAARTIATGDNEQSYFVPDLLKAAAEVRLPREATEALVYLRGWDGKAYDASVAPALYNAWLDALREDLFTDKLGSLGGPANFRLAAQPTIVWNALHKKTRLDYLEGRSAAEVMRRSFVRAVSNLSKRLGPNPAAWQYAADRIPWKGLPETLYSNRGTYIQIVGFGSGPIGRFVAPPGVSENPDSPSYSDQASLAANWAYFPMLWKRTSFPR
jgi:penicillin amidase